MHTRGKESSASVKNLSTPSARQVMLTFCSTILLQMHAPMMHLRSLNPYVMNAIGEWQKQHGLSASVPRAAAPNSRLITYSGRHSACCIAADLQVAVST